MPIIGLQQSGGKALVRNGPSLSVRIHPLKPARLLLEKKGRQAPIEEAFAVIDTGAGCTCIDEGIARRLNLTPRDEVTVHTAGGAFRQSLYDIEIHIPSLGLWRELPVLGSSLAPQPHLVLLGRDILALGTLVYSGWKGSFEFCV